MPLRSHLKRPAARAWTVALGAVCLGLAACPERNKPAVRAAPSRPAPRDAGQALTPMPGGVTWPVAPGWRREAFPLPPSFATTLPSGHEELRFAPGFQDPRSEHFWSYAFVWLLPEHTALDGPALSQMLEQYFRGICTELGGGRFTLRPERFDAHLARMSEPATEGAEGGESALFRGTLEGYECMVSGAEQTLHVRVDLQDCPQIQRRAVMVLLSPQPDGHLVWHELDQRRAEFSCL